MKERDEKWDRRFIELAQHVALWSKDPSTQCGAVITDGKRIRSIGFNGFAQGVSDCPEDYQNRDVKYAQVIHAEINALLFSGGHAQGCTVYVWPFQSCAACAAVLIQAGIKRVVAPIPSGDRRERWKDSFAIAEKMFQQAGVELDLYEL